MPAFRVPRPPRACPPPAAVPDRRTVLQLMALGGLASGLGGCAPEPVSPYARSVEFRARSIAVEQAATRPGARSDPYPVVLGYSALMGRTDATAVAVTPVAEARGWARDMEQGTRRTIPRDIGAMTLEPLAPGAFAGALFLWLDWNETPAPRIDALGADLAGALGDEVAGIVGRAAPLGREGVPTALSRVNVTVAGATQDTVFRAAQARLAALTGRAGNPDRIIGMSSFHMVNEAVREQSFRNGLGHVSAIAGRLAERETPMIVEERVGGGRFRVDYRIEPA